MPLTPDYRAYALELLERAAPVAARTMFGGAGLYCDGLIFGLLDDDRAFFKADESNAALFDAHGSAWFHPYGDERTMPYREVPVEVLEDPEQLRPWIAAAVEVARRKRAARTPKQPKQKTAKKPAKKKKTAG